MEYPVEGFGEIITEFITICDGCSREIDSGETVSYHLRLGSVYCRNCRDEKTTVSE